MSLRINTNLSAIRALRHLRLTERRQSDSMLRLSTGLRINSAGDDPSGLVIANKMRSQVAGLDQAMENTRRDRGLLGTTDAALSEIETILDELRQAALFALNSGSGDTEQLSAEQVRVDQMLSAIDRIASTTTFGSRRLLDGSSAHRPTAQSVEITQVDMQNLAFAESSTTQTYSVVLTTLASQAYGGDLNLLGLVAGTMRISGKLGTETFELAPGVIPVAELRESINAAQFKTGVYASTDGNLFSRDFGSDAFVRVEQATILSDDTGVDVAGRVNGLAVSGRGNVLRMSNSTITGTVELNPLTSALATTYSFDVSSSTGLRFQLNDSVAGQGQEHVGISAVHSSTLGTPSITTGGVAVGGFLNSLRDGGANDLTSDPANALRVIDAARDQILTLRAYIGSFMSNILDPNESALEAHKENLTSAESEIRDLDFAAEMTTFTREQILFQSGTMVLGQANLIPQAVLSLLQ